MKNRGSTPILTNIVGVHPMREEVERVFNEERN